MFVFANGFNDKGAWGIVKKLGGKNRLSYKVRELLPKAELS